MTSWTPTEKFSWADDVEKSIPLPSWPPSNSAKKNEAERPKEKSTTLNWGDEYVKRAGVSAERIHSKMSESNTTGQTAMEEDQSGEGISSAEISPPAGHGVRSSLASASPLEANLSADGEADTSESTSTDLQGDEEVVASPTGSQSEDEEELPSPSSVLSQICEDAWGKDVENSDSADEQSHEKDFAATLTEKLLCAASKGNATENGPEGSQSDGKDEEHNTGISASNLRHRANEGQRADAVELDVGTEKRPPGWKVWVVLCLFALCYCCLCMNLGMLCHPA